MSLRKSDVGEWEPLDLPVASKYELYFDGDGQALSAP